MSTDADSQSAFISAGYLMVKELSVLECAENPKQKAWLGDNSIFSGAKVEA